MLFTMLFHNALTCPLFYKFLMLLNVWRGLGGGRLEGGKVRGGRGRLGGEGQMGGEGG